MRRSSHTGRCEGNLSEEVLLLLESTLESMRKSRVKSWFCYVLKLSLDPTGVLLRNRRLCLLSLLPTSQSILLYARSFLSRW
jgi:hypothetical protein